MSIKLNLTIICLCLATSVFGQTHRKCVTTPHKMRMQNDPVAIARKEAMERATAMWIANNQADIAQNRNAVITIPVVVHVVYRTTAQNISDAQVQSQIAVLNRDYRKLNTDIGSVPSVWQPLAADVQVQFCLAARTPTGTATNGITRTVTTRSFFWDDANTSLDPDIVKNSATGGKTGWNPSKYLNIWVCRLDRLDGTLGYSYYPSEVANTPELDGCVIDYRCFGTTGTAGTGTFVGLNLGRTVTHEVGHYLNLAHTWGEDDPNGPPCQSDYVSDTPAAFEPVYGCETFPFNVGTQCITDANGQMFMNYMDYVDDNCMNMFTLGQSARMLAAINTSRASLITSNGCLAPVPVELMSFEGKTQGRVNHLFWTTASEINNAYFDVERSFDGQNFQKIGQIKGFGTSAERRDYAFDDLSFNGITAYYRLNQVDFDGKSTLSNTISLQNGKTNRVKIFPNPVGSEGVLVQVENEGKKEILLQDVTGKTLFATTSTDLNVRISTTNLARGLYFVSVRLASGFVDVQKLVVR
jgi:Pregnancy-associated plasma protein-A/Secretion system C-terminal sorting domain